MPTPRLVVPAAVMASALALAVAAASVTSPSAAATAGGAPGPRVAPAAPVTSATEVSNRVSCPDPVPVDWARPRVLHSDPAVVVRRYTGRQQGGRDLVVTVAAGRARAYRLVARGPRVVGTIRTTSASMAAAPTVVVGVNGGYFWRSDTGREFSKGTQVRAGRVFYHRAGETRYVGADVGGVVRRGVTHVEGSVVVRPRDTAPGARLPVVAVNSAPAGDGVAVYTNGWNGSDPRVVVGWELLVRRGVVIASGRSLRASLVESPAAERRFLVQASGGAVAALRRVRVGQRVTYTARAVDRAGRVVTEATVSGTTLLVDGRVTVSCTRAPIRPRTMVAWNRRTGALWLVTATGGERTARFGMFVGASYRQMALVAQRLGATDAVLVDGGGSTTMVVRTRSGLRRVDGPTGRQRAVPDILGIVAR